MIELSEEIRAGWCVVSVRGRADAVAAEKLEAWLCAAIEKNSQVAADFSALDYISSCGLRAVLQAARAAQERNVRFTVCSMSAPVRKVFDISRLHDVIEIQEEAPC
jgi:anti-sigma B factor antagonist